MPEICSVDAETHSPVNLNTAGSDAYARDPRTDCLYLAYHPVGYNYKPYLWRRGDPVPYGLKAHIDNGGRFAGWNVENFDRLIWAWILVPRYGFPPIPDDRWVDSMHLAAAANLPRSLDGCAEAVGAAYQAELKDNTKLRRITNALVTPVPSEEDMEWLGNRCVQDVMMEEDILRRLPQWPQMAPWLKMPNISRKINDRGILMDVELVKGLAHAATVETARLDVEMDKLTRGRVPKTSTVEKLKEWLVFRGIELPRKIDKKTDEEKQDEALLGDESDAKDAQDETAWRLRKSDIADILAGNIPEDCRLALEWRQEAAKASARKLNTMLRHAGPDGRLYRSLVLGGAQQTLRWSGSGWQPHNLPRDVIGNSDEVAEQNGFDSKIKEHKPLIASMAEMTLRTAIEVGRTGDTELIRSLFTMTRKDNMGRSKVEGVLPFVSRMLRRTLTAPRGHLLLNGDFSQIEARIPVWLAGQTDKVAAYARGDDIYRIQAAPIFGMAPEALSKLQRQIGKVTILACGFAGGVGAFVPMAMNYGMRISKEEAIPIVAGFRQDNAMLAAYWNNNLTAARNALSNPGREFPVGPTWLLTWFKDPDRDCLCLRLPSWRLLRYWSPRLQQGYWPDGKPKDTPDLTVLTVKGRAVFRRTLWRGLAIENPVQAIAADLLANALSNMDDVDIFTIMHVHDSAHGEEDEDRAEMVLPIFKQAMLAVPDWCKGLPVAAEVDISTRIG